MLSLSLLLSRMGSLCLWNLREKLQISQISRMVNSREIPKSWCPKILKFPTFKYFSTSFNFHSWNFISSIKWSWFRKFERESSNLSNCRINISNNKSCYNLEYNCTKKRSSLKLIFLINFWTLLSGQNNSYRLCPAPRWAPVEMQVLPATWQLLKLAKPTNFISVRNDLK